MTDLPPPPPPHDGPGTVWVPPSDGHDVPPPPPGSHQPYATWPPQQRNRRAIIAALAATVVIVAAAITVPVVLLGKSKPASSSTGSGAAGSAAPGPSATADSRAAALYQAALSATRSSSGCHYVAQTSGGGLDQKIVGDAGKDDGMQLITLDSTYGAEQFTLVLSNNVVYFKGNVPALLDQVGAPSARAQTLANTWISVSQGDGPYSVLQPGITLASQAQELTLVPSSESSVTSGGTTATRIQGTVPAQQGAPAGTGHVDVASGTNLPLSYVSSISGNGITITSTTTFSAWGSAPTVSVPSSATPWASIGASEPPGGYGSGGTGGSPGSATPIPL